VKKPRLTHFDSTTSLQSMVDARLKVEKAEGIFQFRIYESNNKQRN
jgi:hypothetical protein